MRIAQEQRNEAIAMAEKQAQQAREKALEKWARAEEQAAHAARQKAAHAATLRRLHDAERQEEDKTRQRGYVHSTQCM